MKLFKIRLKQKSGFLVRQKPNYKLAGFQEIIEHIKHSVHKTERRPQVLNKNNQIKKQIILGAMVMFLLGVLVLGTSASTAVITQVQQPPIDIPQPGIPFEIPSDGTPPLGYGFYASTASDSDRYSAFANFDPEGDSMTGAQDLKYVQTLP